MIVKKYKAKVIAIENKIEGVYTLTLNPEKGRFRYSPGQFLHIAIDSDYDGASQWPESRCFSLQTSPEETYAQITYAVKGDFTTKMEQVIKMGSEVWLKLPYGELFDQEHNRNHTVFISGGTGITPYLSLFTDTSFSDYKKPVLYAGFRSSIFNLYMNEIQKAVSINPNLIVNNVYQDVDGILDIDRIFTENAVDASYFISGPPVMIKLFKQKLISKGVKVNDILTDDWE
jgi:predicted ferric reductase